VRDREIDDRQPQHHEQHQRPELHAFGKGTDDQRRRDAGEGHLEDHEDEFGQIDVVREGRRVGGIVTPARNALSSPPTERAARGEGHRIAPATQTSAATQDDHEDLHQHAQHVLGADEAAIEQRQRRHRSSSAPAPKMSSIQAVSPLSTMPAICSTVGALIGGPSCARRQRWR
jgi:hypothetical protein